MNNGNDKQSGENYDLSTVWTSKTLSIILRVWFLSGVVTGIGSWWLGNAPVTLIVVSITFTGIFTLIPWLLARAGRPRLGISILAIMSCFAIGLTLIGRIGLASHVAYGFMTVIMVIGFVVGRRSSLMLTILIAIFITIVLWVQLERGLEGDELIRTQSAYIFLQMRLLLTATFTYFAAQAIENAFDTVRGRTAELTKANAHLLEIQSDNIWMRRALERSNAALEASNAELQMSEVRYRTIVTSLGDAYFISRPPDGRLIDLNEAGCAMFGYTREEMLAMTGDELDAGWAQDDFPSFYEGLRNEDNDTLRMGQYTHKTGHVVPVEIRASLIELDGKPAVFTIVRDMSEREVARANLEASLHEKEVLLREIHHRVKNNLQVVKSMMRTSSRKFPDDPLIQSELNDLESRVMSMAAIHQQLYQSGDFAQIEFAAYMRKLVKEIGHTHIPQSKEITLEFNLQPLDLSLETAVPAGLIINELVINAIKHGYPPDKKGGVIRCKMVVDRYRNRVYLTIENDGLPFDVNDVEDGHTTGMQLVDLLVRQLGGELIATIENGVSGFTFSFQVREERVPK